MKTKNGKMKRNGRKRGPKKVDWKAKYVGLRRECTRLEEEMARLTLRFQDMGVQFLSARDLVTGTIERVEKARADLTTALIVSGADITTPLEEPEAPAARKKWSRTKSAKQLEARA